jgi:DNA-binding FadR family transcriptional regulator
MIRRPSPPPTGALRGTTLASQLADELIRDVLRGRYRPGDPLPTEEDLARTYAVSRAVVREAVQAISMLGLTDRRQGRNTQVTFPTEWNDFAPELLRARAELGIMEDVLVELLELRRLVEVEAAALAAERATDGDIGHLQEVLGQMDATLDNRAGYTALDLAFHDVLLQATGNHLLPRLFAQLRPVLEVAREVSAMARPDAVITSQREHRAICEAVASRSPEAARSAMIQHLSWTANIDFSERIAELTRRRRQQR